MNSLLWTSHETTIQWSETTIQTIMFLSSTCVYRYKLPSLCSQWRVVYMKISPHASRRVWWRGLLSQFPATCEHILFMRKGRITMRHVLLKALSEISCINIHHQQETPQKWMKHCEGSVITIMGMLWVYGAFNEFGKS